MLTAGSPFSFGSRPECRRMVREMGARLHVGEDHHLGIADKSGYW